MLSLVQQDIARLICTIINYFSHLVVKRGELARIIATRGDFRSLTVTLELVRHRQRVAYFSDSDPVLREENRDRRTHMAKRERSLPSLLTIRALLCTKLSVKDRVLMLPEN